MVTGVLCTLVLVVPGTAQAEVTVQRDAASGALRVVASGDAPTTVTLSRSDDGAMLVDVGAATLTSPDASCSAPTAAAPPSSGLSCPVAAGQVVQLALGAGSDVVDTRAASGIALSIDAGAGADTIIAGSRGTTTVLDATTSDTVDLGSATSGLRVRYEPMRHRVVARCSACPESWAVVLPAAPGRVVLGPGEDDVDLGGWGGRAATRWDLGAGDDRFWGAPLRRSVVLAGAGTDRLVSRGAAVDAFSGGPGMDAMLDLGGTGDVLRGDGGTDSFGSVDGRRDTVDGGAGADACISTSRELAGCDTRPGGVRRAEQAIYLPVHTLRLQLQMLGMA